MASSSGRLVLNHSTHIPGLLALLERLLDVPEITTITPGALSRARGHAPQLKLRVSVPITGGYKLIARQGKTVQEVFVVADLEREALEAAIAEL